jgi:hypothetical protein
MIMAALVLAGATVVAAQTVTPPTKPSQEERAAVRAQVFAQADADGNGALTPEELATFKTLMRQRYTSAKFARIDSNGDGQVTLDELQAARMNKHHCRGKGGPNA